MAKGKRLSPEEFENICNNSGISNTFEISKRYDNYLMYSNTTRDGRSSTEVGANINIVELEEN